MSLHDYCLTHARDKFEPDDRGLGLCFPCCACVHRHKPDTEEPCRTCDHNVDSVSDEGVAA